MDQTTYNTALPTNWQIFRKSFWAFCTDQQYDGTRRELNTCPNDVDIVKNHAIDPHRKLQERNSLDP